MRVLFFALTVFLLWSVPASACDDHHGKCELDAWRGYRTGDYVTIEGSATCDKGHIVVRFYDGEKFLAMEDGYIKGHAVRVIATNVSSYSDLKIKYSIKP